MVDIDKKGNKGRGIRKFLIRIRRIRMYNERIVNKVVVIIDLF